MVQVFYYAINSCFPTPRVSAEFSFSSVKDLVNSTVGKATEMTSEACGYHSQLATEEGLTSKPLFILLTNCGQAAKVSVGEKLFTDLFSVSLSLRNAAQKTATKKELFFLQWAFRVWGETVSLYSSFLRTKWTCPLFFSLPLMLLFLSLALPRNGCHDNQAQSHQAWLTFFAFKHLFSYFNESKLANLHIFYVLNVYCFDESFVFVLLTSLFFFFIFVCLLHLTALLINRKAELELEFEVV